MLFPWRRHLCRNNHWHKWNSPDDHHHDETFLSTNSKTPVYFGPVKVAVAVWIVEQHSIRLQWGIVYLPLQAHLEFFCLIIRPTGIEKRKEGKNKFQSHSRTRAMNCISKVSAACARIALSETLLLVLPCNSSLIVQSVVQIDWWMIAAKTNDHLWIIETAVQQLFARSEPVIADTLAT